MAGLVNIRYAEIRDYESVYRWLFFSDFSEYLTGISTANLPSFEEFKKDYESYFFDGSAPEKGRSYIITLDDKEDIGHISYTSYHLLKGIAEFDIWLSDLKYTGKGYGTKAISLLAEKIFKEGYQKIIIRPVKTNIRAIRSYQKAGFIKSSLIPEKYYKPVFIDLYAEGDFGKGNDVFMILEKEIKPARY